MLWQWNLASFTSSFVLLAACLGNAVMNMAQMTAHYNGLSSLRYASENRLTLSIGFKHFNVSKYNYPILALYFGILLISIFLQLLAGQKKAPSFWTFEYYQAFFDVDTNQVRCCVSFLEGNSFHSISFRRVTISAIAFLKPGLEYEHWLQSKQALKLKLIKSSLKSNQIIYDK